MKPQRRAELQAQVEAGIRPHPERHAVMGRRIDLTAPSGGEEPCTVLIVREIGGDGWVLYPHGAAGLAVELSRAAAETLAHGILGTTGSGS